METKTSETESKLMLVESKYEVNGEEVKLTGNIVKNYLTRGNDAVSDQDIVMFINLCRYKKLNPFLNEAFLVKFKGSPAQIITSKEAYMKRADANPNYDGLRAGLILQRKDQIIEVEGSFTLPEDKLLGGWAEVFRKDKKYPYVTKVGFDEYNKGQSTWNQKPKTMIRKVAIVQALREAFPTDLGALYVEEEGQENTVEDAVKGEITEKANAKLIDIVPENKAKDNTLNSSNGSQQKINDEPDF